MQVGLCGVKDLDMLFSQRSALLEAGWRKAAADAFDDGKIHKWRVKAVDQLIDLQFNPLLLFSELSIVSS